MNSSYIKNEMIGIIEMQDWYPVKWMDSLMAVTEIFAEMLSLGAKNATKLFEIRNFYSFMR